jgi:hypothetical protein
MAFAAPIPRRLTDTLPYKSAIFFENSAQQRRDIIRACPTVAVVKKSLDEAPPDADFILVDIPETEPLLSETPVESLPFYDADNQYVVLSRIRSESYDPVSGIQEPHITDILEPWIESRPEGKHIAIFDWDRTLTIMEGIRLSNLPGLSVIGKDPREYYINLLTHVCGGPERFAMLQAMFKKLRDANIHILILTNNPSGRYKMFDEMIQVFVDAPKPAYSIIVSHGPGYGGIKANVFLFLPQFSKGICKRPPIPAPPPYTFKPIAENEENLYAYGGARRLTRRRRRHGKTLRRMLRRMMRRSRRRVCGKTRHKVL